MLTKRKKLRRKQYHATTDSKSHTWTFTKDANSTTGRSERAL